MPGTILGNRDTVMNETDKNPHPRGIYFLVRRDNPKTK